MIELKNVCKSYGLTKALKDVSFSVKKGEIIGFVGPNGAGKSTAMKIITTFTAPTSGTVSVGGYNVMSDPLEVRELIGYLPERVPLYSDMLVREYLEFIGEARHLNGRFKTRFDWVVDACGLESVLERKIDVLSKGYKQRTCLAQALIHDPEVLILDEPTSGLDPLQIIGIRNLVKNLAHDKTIILSTHILPEVSTVADRILVINDGQIVADGSFGNLIKTVTDLSVIYLAVQCAKKEFQTALSDAGDIESIEIDSATPRGITGAHLYHAPDRDILPVLNKIIRKNNWLVVELVPERLSLEESFIRLTQSHAKTTQKSKKLEVTGPREGGAA